MNRSINVLASINTVLVYHRYGIHMKKKLKIQGTRSTVSTAWDIY